MIRLALRHLAGVAAGLAGLLLATALLGAPGAAAETLLALDERVDTVRGWDIGINTAVAGCLAKARYEDKTTVWFGFGGDDKKLFFGLSNPRWKSIESGRSYEIHLVATNAGRWHGTFAGGEADGERSLVATNLKKEFMVDIARAGALDVRFQGKSITRLSLSGSMAALDAVIDCQKELNARGTEPRRQPPAQAKGGGGGGQQEGGTSSGTGFFVSDSGHVLTNFHVIEGCKVVEITRPGSVAEKVVVIARDQTNDLALLKAATGPAAVPAIGSRTRIGDSIYVYGFPLAGLLSSGGNFTIGNVTATSGLNDDSRMVQISAPVQPGNSGGPLMDQSGNVVGVVVSKLNALRLASVTKDLAQNVNFAIKGSVALTFLDGNGITPPAPGTTPAPDAATIAEKAKAFTVFVECR
ncbi:serine protease [Xanthobacter autotrophicus DSM 431]|uniref:S1 family peptidase n=1 Tax=Xanthobacter nonsaccharivorans TaxID=3119912 RepID=UPI00372857DF